MPISRALMATALILLAAAPAAFAARRSVPQGFYGMVWDGEVRGADPSVQDDQWGRMAAAGAESARTVFSWAEAQPDPGGPIDFGATDLVVAQSATHGIGLLPVVVYAPAWARSVPELGNSPPARTGDYSAYLEALVARYGPQGTLWAERPDLPRRPVREWQVWNEPQLRNFWNAPEYERGYGELLRASFVTLRRADPGARVVLAAATNFSWRVLDGLYRRGGIGGHFDVVAIHPYTSSGARALKVVRLVRAVMRRRRDARLPVWVTELGFPAARGRADSSNPLATTPRGMATRLTRAFALLARHRRDRDVGVERVYWYTWASPYRGDDIFRYSGLVRFDDGRARAVPALAAYRRSARGHEGCAKTRLGACR